MRNFYSFTAVLIAVCACASAYADKTAYGYQYASKTNQSGFVSFDVDAPQTLVPQKSLSTYEDILVSAGEYVDGKIYTYTVELGEYYEIYPFGYKVYDAETLSVIETSDGLNRRVIDMTYDYTTNTMYALVEDKYNTSTVGATSLCVVDLESGEYRVIGGPGEIKAYDGYGNLTNDGLLTIACDATGQLYAMSHFRYLYKVDKFTGKASDPAPQHNLGTASQFQTMAFDTDGTLWWAQQHPDYGHFCSIDMTTGIPGGFVDFHTDYEKLNKLGDDVQMTCLYFKDKEINKQSPLAVTSLTAVAHADGVQKVDLNWVLPTTDYSDNATEVSGVKIYRIGTSELVGTVGAGVTSFTDENAPAGNITYEVIPFNASGNGFPAFVETFAGYDQLDVVQNIALVVDERTATVSWEKPLATINGGYADFNAITYNVYRCVGDNEQLVKENTSETSFTETINTDGRFFYIIEPVCGGVAGKRAQSDSFVLSSPASVPYSTGFEDDQDGSQWMFINDGAKGWSITKGTRAFDGKYADGATGGSSDLGNDWLISPGIYFPAPGAYILTFWANGASYDTQTLDVLLGTDKSDVASFTQLIHAFNDELVCDTEGKTSSEQWLKCEYEFNVDAEGLYYLGFHNKTTTTFAHFCIDNLSLTEKPFVATIPYTTGFEDEEDGAQWSFINDGAKGWSITKGTRAFDGKYAEGATGGSSDLGNDWLISPAISFSAAGDYILTFWANGASYDKQTLDIRLGTDKSDVTSFTQLIHAFNDELVYDPEGKNAAAQWLKCEYEFNVATGGTYYLGFHNKTTAVFANFCIDNLSLDEKTTGINSVGTDDELAAPVYYNIQGLKVDNPTSGLYIVKRGNKITKEYIR